MSQPEITLYHCPGACSQVAVCALEMAGLDYKLELVNLGQGAQLSAEYGAINKMGKVPYLVVDGEGLGENLAILSYLAELRPEAGIFPKNASARMRAEALSGMSFCSGTLHPIVRGMFNPGRMTTGDTAGVIEKAKELGKKSFGFAEARLAKKGWWLGEPSIVDVYLNWAWSVAVRGGFDTEPYPNLSGLRDKLTQLPAFVTMLDEEADSLAKLAA